MPITSRAQNFLKQLSRFEIIAGGENLKLEQKVYFNGNQTPGRGHEEKLSTFCIGAAINFPVFQFSDDLSVGIATGFDGGFVKDESSSSGSDMDGNGFITSEEQGGNFPYKFGIINLPLMATLKYGGDATLMSTMKFGAGVGIGYQETYLFIKDLTYDLPIVSAEISFGNQRLLKVRATKPLKDFKPDANTIITQYNITLGVIGLF